MAPSLADYGLLAHRYFPSRGERKRRLFGANTQISAVALKGTARFCGGSKENPAAALRCRCAKNRHWTASLRPSGSGPSRPFTSPDEVDCWWGTSGTVADMGRTEEDDPNQTSGSSREARART